MLATGSPRYSQRMLPSAGAMLVERAPRRSTTWATPSSVARCGEL